MIQIKSPCKKCLVTPICQKHIDKCEQAQDHCITWYVINLVSKLSLLTTPAITILLIYLSESTSDAIAKVFFMCCIMMIHLTLMISIEHYTKRVESYYSFTKIFFNSRPYKR